MPGWRCAEPKGNLKTLLVVSTSRYTVKARFQELIAASAAARSC
ncbi:hypothetical protein SynNOUM97013_02026 [Synechococcus sp. NOUM97013]|nr:hypothetical protein SynNOUM97013_02026 [Synechococcus sp. NOUM97013]